MRQRSTLRPGLPEVCRLGLATRGGCGLTAADVERAIARGVNYLNWCGHPDGLSAAVSALGARRSEVVVAVQFEARTAADAARELDTLLAQLHSDYLDI